MLQDNLKFEYLSIKKICEITGASYETLKKRCYRGKYLTRNVASKGGKSGSKYEILFSSLELDLQQKILISCMGESTTVDYLQNPPAPFNSIYSDSNTNSIHLAGESLMTLPALLLNFSEQKGECEDRAVLTSTNNTQNSSFFEEKVIPENAKKIALAKYDIVSDWQNFRKEQKNKNFADNEYILAFNKGLISKELRNLIGKLSKGSLYRWHRTLKENNNNYIALINNYNYCSESKLNTTLSNIEKQEFIRLYYNDAKLNIATAYHLLNLKLSKQGIKIKSIATFRRFAEYIRRNHKDFVVLSREGEKALKDTVAPFNRRDISDINVGDALVADGNKLDFMIINPYTGKPARAIWVVFFDWYSFDVAGYEIMLTENTQNISSALRNSIIRLGKIPKKVYMDNGRAFRGSYFKGCEDFNQCGFQGVYKNLGIDEVVAKPYNGRSKIVERFFGDFVRSCPPLVASYTGNSITNKPAHLKRNEKFHKELHKNDKIPTIEQAKEIIEAWLNEFHRKRPCPHDKTKSIGEVFESGTGAGVNIEMLDELMMSSCIRTAKRNTIRLFGLEYESTALYGLEDKVVVKYSLFDISKIKIYSLKNEYIGEAKTVVPMKAFVKDGTASDLYRYRMQQKQHNNLLKQTFKKTKTLIGSLRPFEDFSWGQIEELGNIPCLEEKRNRKKLEITIYENAHLYNQQKTKLRI